MFLKYFKALLQTKSSEILWNMEYPMGFLNPMFMGFQFRTSILDFLVNQTRDWYVIQFQILQNKQALKDRWHYFDIILIIPRTPSLDTCKFQLTVSWERERVKISWKKFGGFIINCHIQKLLTLMKEMS